MQLLSDISTITSIGKNVCCSFKFSLSESMECAQLSIKEETEDETKYGSKGVG
jgi:hypothetical protein